MDAERIAKGLEKSRLIKPGQWIACCPAHDDKTPSLTIKQEGDKVLLHCFAQCSKPSVLSALIGRGLWYETGKKGYEVERPRYCEDQLERCKWFCLVWNSQVRNDKVPSKSETEQKDRCLLILKKFSPFLYEYVKRDFYEV